MTIASPLVQTFFESYERGTHSADPELIGAHYADVFMFGGPQGTQAVKKEDFLKVLPRRQGFFQSIGLTSTTLRALDESALDEHYLLVRATWAMHFTKDPAKPIVDENHASYILFRQGDSLRIVCQLDHQDLMEKARALGLLPPA